MTTGDSTESLDEPSLARQLGPGEKADYLLNNRNIVAELKTINGDPKNRVEHRLQEWFSQPGAPIVMGRYGLAAIFRAMPDGHEMSKLVIDLSIRAVRRHLYKSNNQVLETKRRLGLSHASGLLVIMNESERMIDAASIGYGIRSAIESSEDRYEHLKYIWVSVESHKVRLPDGSLGYPQLFVSRSNETQPELTFFASMLEAWARFNGGELRHLPHGTTWDSLTPVFEGGPPTIGPFFPRPPARNTSR